MAFHVESRMAGGAMGSHLAAVPSLES